MRIYLFEIYRCMSRKQSGYFFLVKTDKKLEGYALSIVKKSTSAVILVHESKYWTSIKNTKVLEEYFSEWVISSNENRCLLKKRKVKGCGYFTVITTIIVIWRDYSLLLVHKAINLSLLSNKQLSPTCTDRLIESIRTSNVRQGHILTTECINENRRDFFSGGSSLKNRFT
jgi:hypothetical protein